MYNIIIVAAISPLTPVVVVHAVGLGATAEEVDRIVYVYGTLVYSTYVVWSGNAPVLLAIMNAPIRQYAILLCRREGTQWPGSALHL